MKHSSLYLLLSILGAAFPLSQLYPFLLNHGLDLSLFFEQLFANSISSLFGLDVIISAIVLLVFIFAEGKRLGMQQLWIPTIGLCIGVSFSFPLFLYLRQRHLEQDHRHKQDP